MEITWYGHSCFRIAERNRVTIITDPYSDDLGLGSLKLKGDVVTISHDSPSHNHVSAVKSDVYTLRGPGEYEIGNVFIIGLPLHNTQNGAANPNVAYHYQYENLSVLHLGDLAHLPEQSVIEGLGTVNVLLVPVGGGNGLKAAQAAEVVAMIEPHYIIPMHYALPGLQIELDSVDKFLTAMGVSKTVESDALKITVSDLPEQPQVVVLNPQIGK